MDQAGGRWSTGDRPLRAGVAEQVRAGVSGAPPGGGNSLTINVSAWDGASVAQWLRTGGGDLISRYVSRDWTVNPSDLGHLGARGSSAGAPRGLTSSGRTNVDACVNIAAALDDALRHPQAD